MIKLQLHSMAWVCTVCMGVMCAADARGGVEQDQLNKNFIASQDITLNDKWENTAIGNELNWSFDTALSPGTVTDATVPGITAAYAFPAALGEAGDYRHFAGDDVTFELWFKPDGLSGDHVLFETGGDGSGTVFKLNGNALTFRAQESTTAGEFAQVSKTNIDADWQQVVGVIELNVGITLYHNGQFVDSAAASDMDAWVGFNDSGLGRVIGTVAGGGGFTGFDGQIAIMRFYTKALDADMVQDNYLAIIPEPISLILPLVGVLGLRRRKRGTAWECGREDSNLHGCYPTRT